MDALALPLVGAAACCGVSALLTAAAGATVLGLATELWIILSVVGIVGVIAFAVRAASAREA